MNDQVSPAVAGQCDACQAGVHCFDAARCWCCNREPERLDDVKITVTKDVAWIRIDFDDDGHPMYMGERLVELRPGYWVHPWNWELQLQELEGMERPNREHVPDPDPAPVPATDAATAETQDVWP